MISHALVFSTRALQFICLDTKKKQVLGSASVAIPAGVIHRGVVADKAALSQLIRPILTPYLAKLKSLTILIPEDTVVSKSMELPKLIDKELDEAVGWEAERYLPFSRESAVLDWERLPADDKLHVLFQAAPQAVIDGYLDVLSSLGCTVSAIETPALALVRLAESKPGVRILIYLSSTEAILTLARNQEVIATSVVPLSGDFGAVLARTLRDMRGYYQTFPVEWLAVGGTGVTPALVEQLKVFQLPVTGFALPFPMKPELAQPYLLAISAALKPVNPPSDQSSINLLPAWYVHDHFKRQFQRFGRRLMLSTVGYLALLWLGIGGLWGWMYQQEHQLKQQQASPPSLAQTAVAAAGKTNQEAKLALSLAPQDQFPTALVKAIQAKQTDTIRLAKIQLAMIELKGAITGIAKDRMSLLAYKQALETIPELTEVQLPISSFAEEQDIPFQLNITIDGKKIQKEVGMNN